MADVLAPAALPYVQMVDWRPLCLEARPSLFLVLFTPLRGKRKETKRLMDQAGTKSAQEKRVLRKLKWLAETGLASHIDARYLYVLTCAHIIDHLFHAVHSPIQADKVNELFRVQVTCHHAERAFIEGGRVGDRAYAPATVCGIDCASDLMLLRVDLGALPLRFNDDGQMEACPHPHPIPHFSPHHVPAAAQLMLLSWPEFRPCTLATGLYCMQRFLPDMSTNPVGYDLFLLEAYMGSQGGSSGGPLFDSFRRVKGILHGGSGGPHSHFIPSRLILPFIQAYAVPPKPPAPAPSADDKPGPPPGPGPGDRKRGPPKDDKSGGSKRRLSSGSQGMSSKSAAAAGGHRRRRYVLNPGDDCY
ncbi:uncharacterized protein [Triticum aestivum]|uniref:uncharacterized protein n=1 Tax=Triticum aestivum TaxID=4565 RepID=UPI000844BA9D|nr:uncharacterized protein LOC123106306 [Triticum aestivum]